MLTDVSPPVLASSWAPLVSLTTSPPDCRGGNVPPPASLLTPKGPEKQPKTWLLPLGWCLYKMPLHIVFLEAQALLYSH